MKKAFSKRLKKSVSAILATVMTIGLFPFSAGFEVYAEDDPYVELSQTLTAQDTFAWTEYDHDNFTDRYAPSIPDHIIYDGDNIKMVGYGYSAFKDFLLINDTENKNSKKTFSFKIKRDGSDWHSMEGGGFLFNSSVKNNVLSGFCVLVTQSGLKLVQITGVDVDKFRNGSYSYVQNAGKLLKTYSLSNLYGEHDFKIEVNNTSVSVWDGANVVIDGYVLPENNYGYGYGPITSHISHGCSQQSYFTFNDISMEEVVIHYVPKKPIDLKYTINEDSSVALSWTQPDGKADVAGYNIYRDDVQIGTSSETTYTDNVTAGSYSYYINAFDTEDYTSENSESITVDSMPPEVPSLRVDSVSETSAVLSWDCSDNVGVTSYEVYRNNELVKTTSANSYEDSSLEDGTEYVYYVIAYDNAGNKTSSDTVIVNTKADMTQPVIVSLSPASGNYSGAITLKVAARDNRSVKNIVIQISADKKNWENAAEIETNGGASTSVEYSLTPESDGTVYVRAYAINSRGITGEVSSAVQYNFDSSAPEVPANVTLSLENSQIEVRWTAPDDKDTAYFNVYRKTSDSDYTLIKDNYKYLNYYDTDIELGTEYTYCVTAVDKNGNESVKSEAVTGCISDDNTKPQVFSVSPASGSKVGENPEISVSCYDNFKLKDVTVQGKAENANEWSDLYYKEIDTYAEVISFTLDTSDFETGSYQIKVSLTDSTLNKSEDYIATYDYRKCTLSAPVLTAEGAGWSVNLSWTMDNTDEIAGYYVYRRGSSSAKYSVIGSTKKNTVTDYNVIAEETYYYYVEAVDIRGNKVKGEAVSAIPTSEDTIAPTAYAGEGLFGIAGKAVSFDGTGSTDNHHVASYKWDFGDGETSTEAKPQHIFSEEGTYNVSLTVYDSAGNSDTCTMEVEIYGEDYNAVKLRVRGDDGAVLSGARVYCELTGEKIDATTDSTGCYDFIAKKGSYDVYFYIAGYLPQMVTISVTGDASVVNVKLEKGEVVVGSLTTRPLELKEILALGIDPKAPENQKVCEHTVNLTYNKDSKTLWLTTNTNGDIINVNETFNDNWQVVARSFGGSNRGSGSGGGGSSGNSGKSNNSIALFSIHTDISWMTEFFIADLTIINKADDDFALENCTADLNLPYGLSLATTETTNDKHKDMGIIEGGESKTVSWIIRGDEKGEYYLTADFNCVLTPFVEDIYIEFKNEKPLKVEGGDALQLDIDYTGFDPDTDYWVAKFTLTNVSDKPIYDVNIDFHAYKYFDDIEISDMLLEYPSGIKLRIPWTGKEADYDNRVEYYPVLWADDEESEIYKRTLKPNESIVGYYSVSNFQHHIPR